MVDEAFNAAVIDLAVGCHSHKSRTTTRSRTTCSNKRDLRRPHRKNLTKSEKMTFQIFKNNLSEINKKKLFFFKKKQHILTRKSNPSKKFVVQIPKRPRETHVVNRSSSRASGKQAKDLSRTPQVFHWQCRYFCRAICSCRTGPVGLAQFP